MPLVRRDYFGLGCAFNFESRKANMVTLLKIGHAGFLREESPAAPTAVEQEVALLFEQFRRPLFRYLLTLGLTIPDGEEVIQEVFFALFKHLQSGKPRTNLKGWIFRVGHNQALKLRQREYANEMILDEVLPASCPNPEQQAASKQLHQHLAAVIRALPEQDRACLALRSEGFRYRDIAVICGISLGSVAQSLERSLAKLSRVKER